MCAVSFPIDINTQKIFVSALYICVVYGQALKPQIAMSLYL